MPRTQYLAIRYTPNGDMISCTSLGRASKFPQKDVAEFVGNCQGSHLSIAICAVIEEYEPKIVRKKVTRMFDGNSYIKKKKK